MAGTTRYHRLPDDARPSMDDTPSEGEDARLLDPLNDNTDIPTPPSKSKKSFSYSLHPTFWIRLLTLILFITSVSLLLARMWGDAVFLVIVTFLVIIRHVLVIIHYLLTRVISVRVHIEFRRSGSSISTQQKSFWPKWLSGRAVVEVLIDLTLIGLLFGATSLAAAGHRGYDRWGYYRTHTSAPGVIVSWIACGLNVLTIIDMGRPSRLTFAGTISYETDKKDKPTKLAKPTLLPIYQDVEATGAGEVSMLSRKSGADSPVII